ncbi:hypothetical protein LXA43DRAFT_216012 [Ganoderma leucocontextum]|nr:hypothetical protein LXA43DRAFT_216012 [Ganoderma leucocontextum]
MQPSQLEIQREVEALRDIRRRSTIQGGPGSLVLDPDLPNEASQAQAAYWSPNDDSSSSSHESNLDNSSAEGQDDPFHLFWVPARVHPELAPKEFREFLKEHARPDDNPPSRSNSIGSAASGLGRKKSMLSRQYKPSANDGVGEEEEKVVPLRRNRSNYMNANVPQLTISDLQKLEELAEEASQSDDPSRLRSVLRRSLSLNIAPSVIDQMDDLRDPGEDVDAPIIVPPPGQVLRRTARTKIRKAGTGEGAHRFTATRSRRKSITVRAATMEPRSSSDLSSSDHGEIETVRRVSRTKEENPEVPPVPRPESYSVEAAIYEAYAREEAETDQDIDYPALSSSPDIVTELVADSHPVIEEAEPEPEPSASIVSPVIYQPQPQRALSPPSPAESPVPQRTPSPSTPSPSTPSLTTSPSTSESVQQARPPLAHAAYPYPPPSPTPSEYRREKDRKGLFGKWGGDKGSKKNKEKGEREKEKEKETSFFGSLFGSKKKPEEPQSVSSNAAGRETAAALLGASKSSKNYVPPPSPQLGMYARYPIHVERAIYRLSHIKLANPRRPLYEQVLISNLMFWYLGIINKTGQNQGQGQGQNAQGAAASVDKERQEKEKKEREERERAEKEREKQERKESQRKGSLTKPSPNGSRRAETPVRGPQYEMQHRAMEQGYGAYGQSPNGGPPQARASSAPPSPPSSQAQYSPPTPQSQYSVQLVQPQPRHTDSPGSANSQYFEIGDSSQVVPQQYSLGTTSAPQLPPGAMPPVAVEQSWMSQSSMNHGSSSPPPRETSPPMSPSSPGGRRPRSPPQANRYTPPQEKQGQPGGQRSPGRSLSAMASPSPPMAPINGKVKKVMSAHAVPPRQSSEDEDMPLAVWQQQQRRKEF